jgi:hypothetical protein
MAGGYRSALPLLGLSASPVTTQAGYRSHLWRWGGGANAPAPAAVRGGYRSLLAIWTGGAFAGRTTPPIPPTPTQDGHGRQWKPIQDKTTRLQQDDELIALFLAGFAATSKQ